MVLALLALSATLLAQSFSADRAVVDPQCISDDENFTKFFDFLALIFAATGFLAFPALAPGFPGMNKRWTWADPLKRWLRFAVGLTVVFLLLIFLPPQLARVSPLFRPLGLTFFHTLGNVR